jgi:hypothetical protein
MYISEWDLHGAALRLLPAACATRNIPQDMAFLHVYIRMGSTGAADYYLMPQGKYTPRDMAFLHVYISGQSYGAAGRPPCIYRMGSTRCCDYYLCGIYTRDMAFLHISGDGILHNGEI